MKQKTIPTPSSVALTAFTSHSFTLKREEDEKAVGTTEKFRTLIRLTKENWHCLLLSICAAKNCLLTHCNTIHSHTARVDEFNRTKERFSKKLLPDNLEEELGIHLRYRTKDSDIPGKENLPSHSILPFKKIIDALSKKDSYLVHFNSTPVHAISITVTNHHTILLYDTAETTFLTKLEQHNPTPYLELQLEDLQHYFQTHFTNNPSKDPNHKPTIHLYEIQNTPAPQQVKKSTQLSLFDIPSSTQPKNPSQKRPLATDTSSLSTTTTTQLPLFPQVEPETKPTLPLQEKETHPPTKKQKAPQKQLSLFETWHS